MTKIYLSFILVFLLSVHIQAADSTYEDSNFPDDTVIYKPIGFETSALAVSDSIDYEKRLIQNPTVALVKSMLVPGLGQVGNRKYFKAAVVVGLQAWLISSAIDHGREASDFKEKFEMSFDTTERNILYDNFLNSKDQRNKFTWFAVIVTFVSMFDAFADAHLSGFPKDKKPGEDKLSLNIKPLDKNGLYASVAVSF
ncbi:MAG: hypothetical protein IID63_05230 [candidate division Zixibacteria bacterium]|nr:hypothetical protein [candidate division Zixibacteria bacterium]